MSTNTTAATTAPQFPSLSEPLYVIRDDGAYRIPAAEFLGPVSELAKLISNEAETRTDGVFDFHGQPASLVMYRETAYICAELKEFNVKTHYTPAAPGSDVYIPRFRTSAEALLMDFKFTPPAGLHLFFAMTARRGNPDGGLRRTHWSMSEPFFFCALDGVNGTFRLPMPNIFDDGRICLGGNPPMNRSLQGLMDGGLGLLTRNVWQTDLYDSYRKERCEKIVRFNRDSFATLAPEAPLQDLLFRFSNPNVDKMPR